MDNKIDERIQQVIDVIYSLKPYKPDVMEYRAIGQNYDVEIRYQFGIGYQTRVHCLPQEWILDDLYFEKEQPWVPSDSHPVNIVDNQKKFFPFSIR